MTTRIPRRALLAVVLALAGCGKPPPARPPPDDVPVDCAAQALDTATNGACDLKPGTGYETYVPLAGDDQIDFFEGAQGGHHVYAGFLAQGYAPAGKAFVTERVLSPDGKELAIGKYCAPLASDPDVAGWREEVGHRVIFEDGVDIASLDGAAAVLEITVDDLADASLCAPTAPACRARACARVTLHDAGPVPP